VITRGRRAATEYQLAVRECSGTESPQICAQHDEARSDGVVSPSDVLPLALPQIPSRGPPFALPMLLPASAATAQRAQFRCCRRRNAMPHVCCSLLRADGFAVQEKAQHATARHASDHGECLQLTGFALLAASKICLHDVEAES